MNPRREPEAHALESQSLNAHSEAAVMTRVAKAHLASPAVLSVPIRRIATFHPNSLSALVWAMPALMALREGFPGALICSYVRPQLVPLLTSCVAVDEALPRPRGDISAQATLMARLHARGFDCALSFSQSSNAILLAWSTGAPIRAGFSGSRMEALLSHRVNRRDKGAGSFLELARAVGCNVHGVETQGLIQIAPEHYDKADKLLEAAGIQTPFVLIGMETTRAHAIRAYEPSAWAATLSEISHHWPLVLSGTRRGEAKSVEGRFPIVDLGGRTDVMTLAALMTRSRGFVGIDEGGLQLAALLGVPVVGIYGPTDESAMLPNAERRIVRHPVECAPCELARCKWTGADERKCLTRLSPETIAQAARELFGL